MSTGIVSNSQLENHFHGRFAEVRSSFDSFIYKADTLDHYADLENYCDEKHETKAPLFILGEKGVGKSALLANWTMRRKRNRRKNAYLSSTSAHELLFWHAVGCTRTAAKVDGMLLRLMTELKKRFDLTLELPVKNERLSWDLPRFLEQSSKKGSVIIVIDGIHLLTAEDGSEVGLTWLPLEIPHNVHIIVSVSSAIPLPEPSLSNDILTEDMMLPKRPRFINEVNRRQWHVMRVRPHEISLVRNIVLHYCHKTVQADADNQNKFDAFLTSLPTDAVEAMSGVEGLVLFPSQIEDILRHKCSCNPLFLRLLLESLALAAERGYSLWHVLQGWLVAEDYTSLLKLVFDSFEYGFVCTEEVSSISRKRSFRAGGVHTLRTAYPWHPNFAQDAIDALGGNSLSVEEEDTALDSNANVSQIGTASHGSLLDSLENPAWIAAMEEVGYKLRESTAAYINSASAKLMLDLINQTGAMEVDETSKSNRRSSYSMRVKHIVFPPSNTENGNSNMRYLKRGSFDIASVATLYAREPCADTEGGADRRNMRTVNPLQHHASFVYFTAKTDSAADEDEALSRVPSYMLGGRSSEGFGPLLSNALALLYASFRGLTETELWTILNQLRIKENENLEEALSHVLECKLVYECHENRSAYEDVWRSMDMHRRGVVAKANFIRGMAKVDSAITLVEIETLLRITSFIPHTRKDSINYKTFLENVITLDKRFRSKENATRIAPLQAVSDESHLDDGLSVGSLGPVIEASLLSALRCFGVLHSSEHGVLVLPIENYMLRNAIFDKFVAPRGGVDHWHNIMCGYFLRLPSSLRRSEELPWHLECTRKWYVLKSTLADLATFEIMSSSELWRDLVKYWTMLTRGPLYTRNITTKFRKSNDDEEEGQAALLYNIEISAKRGLSDSVSKRLLLKDKMAVFDIVEVYNASIERWVAQHSPTTQDIFTKLSAIGSFLMRFCSSFNEGDAFPPYLRLAVDSKELKNLPLGFSDLKFSSFDGDASEGDRDGSRLQQDRHYFMRRWMWIQFPWFALKFKTELEQILESKKVAIGTVGGTGIAGLVDAGVAGGRSMGMTFRSSKSDHMRGFWDLKRCNPLSSLEATGKSSRPNIRSAHRLSSSLDSEVYPILNFSADNLLSSRKLKPLHKYRRSLKDTLESSKHTQFASPSVRSIRHNTLFPSTGRDLLNRHIDLLRHERDPFILAAAAARAGDKAIPADLDLFTEVQNIYTNDIDRYAESAERVLTCEEQTTKVAKLRSLADKALFYVHEKRRLLDRLKIEYYGRSSLDSSTSSILTSGEDAIESLEKKFEAITAAIGEAEQINLGYQQVLFVSEQNPSHTKHHLRMIEQEVTLARQQLIELVQFRHRIYADAAKSDFEGSKFIEDQARYYESMKKSTMDKKEKQMQNKRDLQLGLLKQGLQKEEIPGYFEFTDDDYVEEVSRLRDAWKDVTLGEYSNDHMAIINSYQYNRHISQGNNGGGLDVVVGAAHDGLDMSMFPLSDDAAPRVIYERNRILSLTKSGSIEELRARFVEAQSLQSSLNAQGVMAESKVVQLRSELTKLTNFLVEITMTSTDSESAAEKEELDDTGAPEKKDSRALDDKLIRKQLHLNQIVRQTEKSETLINEVRVALSNLISLLEANSSLMSALPQKPAPPLLSNADISEALAWCEDKVIAITEVLLYDSSKLAGKPSSSKWHTSDVIDDTQPLAERQVQLAVLMENLLCKDPDDYTTAQQKHSKSAHHKKNKKKIGLSRAALNAKDVKVVVELRSPRAIMVPPIGAFDTDYDAKVQALQSKQDSADAVQVPGEGHNSEGIKQKEALEMSEFLTTALASHDASFLLKRQNLLRSQVSGAVGSRSKGWVVDSLLKTKNLQQYVSEIEAPAHLVSKTKLVKKDVKTILSKVEDEGNTVLSRGDIKSKTQDLLRHRQSRAPKESIP